MMRDLFDYLVLKIKGEPIGIDKRIPFRHLFYLIRSRIIALIRANIKLRCFRLVFIGKGTSIINSSRLAFGKGLSIDRNCFIDALSEDGIKFGDGVSIHKDVHIECTGSISKLGKGLIVESYVGIGSRCFLGCAGGIFIGSNTIIGNYVSFHSENHVSYDLSTPIRLQGVNRMGIRVGRDCWIGAKVTVLDGAEIGDGCIVAAGAVVVKGDYPSMSIIGGVPARVISSRNT